MFKKFESFFNKLFGSVPSWSVKASTVITYVAPLTNTAIALFAGEDAAAEATKIVNQVQSDLTVAAKFASEAHGSDTAPAGLSTALQSVNDNLAELLAAGHIKNPETLSKVTAVVNTITGEISAVIGSLPKAA